MKILLIAVGTRGDIQPFVLIGARLKAAGHEVHLSAPRGFAAMITEKGLIHHPLPMDFQELMQETAIKSALTSFIGKIKAYRWASEIMNRQLSAMWQQGINVSPDLILYHFKGAMAPYLGRRLGVPAWPVMLQPGFTPTRHYPQFLIASRSLGPWGNLISHKLIGGLIKFGSNMMIKRWLKTNKKDVVDKVGSLMDIQMGYCPRGNAPRLHAYSSHIVPLAPDMPKTEIQTGYAFAQPDHYKPSAALEAFLCDGKKPVYVGFGSMPGIDHQRINEALLGALEKTGLRAVVATGWGGFDNLAPGQHVHILTSVPHTWLFPRVAAVIHHGGSGTTHEGLRWGRSGVICPLFADQPFFAHRVCLLGAGKELAQKRITKDRLASALEEAMGKNLTERAARIGNAMKSEDGAGKIVELIKQFENKELML